MRSLVLLLPLALLLLPACPGEAASPVTLPSSSDASTQAVEPVEAGTDPVAQVDAGPKLCGCSLCDPVVSADPCKTSDDCAPATACHAKACVAKANAEPKTPSTVCTLDLQCNAIEANTCACFEGKCALAPRPKKP
ncbi:hypothetical protein BH09MYX1_BH09MYX1_20540 [soil metagenome]